MKKISLSGLFILSLLCSSAQSISPASIEDSVIGWAKIYNYKGAKEPVKLEAKTYSVAQLSICDSFVNWMQASYVPKGGLGDIKRRITGKTGPYNREDAALPPSYGAVATTYLFLKYNASKKIVLENTLGIPWTIMANSVPGWAVKDISSPSQFFFTMPSFELASYSEADKKLHDLSREPHLQPYTTFWVKNMEGGNGTDFVLLSKDNRFPFIKLTKGEYLQALEQAIPRVYEEEKKKIAEREQGIQRNINISVGYLDERKQKWLTGLRKNREKYKNRLGEIALTNAQPNLTELETDRDVFSNGYLTDPESTEGRVPVYRVDPAMAALCTKDRPQWILMGWWWTPNQPVEKHMHESIINNFNFAYLYNFFFDPEKVKGQPYKPLRSPYWKETVTVTEASESSKKIRAEKNVVFFEDFSTTSYGQKPVGWSSKLNPDGQYCAVVTLGGEPGNWTELKGNAGLIPQQLKKPLPQNFTISYDVVAPRNFTWGGKPLTFQLAKETKPGNAESFLNVGVRPGFDGRNGELAVEAQFPTPPGYFNGNKWAVATGFSNDKKNNRIKVTIQKKEEDLFIFIDGNKVAEYTKAIPAALLFNALSFGHGWSDGDTEKYYISNIRITKD